jgi:hypothetical protein
MKPEIQCLSEQRATGPYPKKMGGGGGELEPILGLVRTCINILF